MNKVMPKRRGRPSKPYRTSWGETVDGLTFLKSEGRWRIVGTTIRFAESDERRAVQRFRQWQAEQAGETVEFGEILPPSPKVFSASKGSGKTSSLAMLLLRGGKVSDAELWAYVRDQIIERPEFVAKKIGIPELARLADLPKSQPSPTLKSLGDLYQEKSAVGGKQLRAMRLHWGRFLDFMAGRNVATLRALTADHAAAFDDEMKSTDYSPKYIKHCFAAVRGVINFAAKRGINPDDCRHGLDCLKVLNAPRQKAKMPRPIEVEDFQKLLAAADKDRDRAVLLVMLNLAMYPSEALALDWGEIDFKRKTVVTDRNKTGMVRIGVLWDRTIEALKKIQPKNTRPEQAVFRSEQSRIRLATKTWSWRFTELRQGCRGRCQG